jgi:YbbR-like protein
MIRILEITFHNFLAKFVALFLAVATWFYVFDIVNDESFPSKKESFEEILEKYRFMSKDLDVKPVYMGKSPEGYKVLFEKVTINPPVISVVGPEKLLEKIEELKTDRIELGEYTRSVTLKTKLHSDSRTLKFEDKMVEVYLPVERIADKQ